MKGLGVTFGITLLISLVTFGAVKLLLRDAQVAEGVAAFPLVASPHLFETLDRLNSRRRPPSISGSAFSLRGYLKPWPIMSICGALTIVGLMQLLPVVGLLPVVIVENTADSDLGVHGAMMAALSVAIPLAVVGAYLVGRWIGHRASRHGLIAVLIAGVVGAAAAQLIDIIFLSNDKFFEVYEMNKSGWFFAVKIGVSSALYTIAALIGYLVGMRHRMARYIGYLISILPPTTAEVLVSMATDEANRIAQRERPAAVPPMAGALQKP
jgi:hypothetical protein